MQHNIIQSYQTAAGSLTGTLAVTGDTEINADVVLAASSTDVELDVAFAKANVKSIAMTCSAACTVETNANNHAGGNQIDLVAGQPTLCKNNTEAQAMFTNDVTKLFLTCSAGGTFSIRILLDQTP